MALAYYTEQGPAGPEGPQGPTGPAGATGAAGTNGVGVPVGGTTGQVLSKIDGTNYNTQWTTVASGGGGGFDALGTLLTGRYYGLARRYDATAATLSTGSGLIRYAFLVPFSVAVAGSIDRIAINVTSGDTASSVRIGIYRAAADGSIGDLVLDAGVVSSVTTGLKEITVASTALSAGNYFGVVRNESTQNTALSAEPVRGGNTWRGETNASGPLNSTSLALGVSTAFGVAGSLPASGAGYTVSAVGTNRASISVRGA